MKTSVLYRRWLVYVGKHRNLLAAGFVFILVMIAIDIGIPKFITFIIDHMLRPEVISGGTIVLPLAGNVSLVQAFAMLFVLLAAFVLIRAVSQYWRTVLLTKVGELIHLDIRNALFGHIQRLPIAYFDKSYTGRIMARITSDTDALWGLLFNGMNGLVAPLLSFIVVIVVVARTNVWLTLLLLVVIPVFFALYSQARKKVMRAGRLQRETLSGIYSRLQEQISGIRIVRMFGRSRDESAIYDGFLRKLFNRNMILMKCHGALGSKGDFIVGFGTALILCGGGIAVAAGQITVGELVQFYAYAGLIFVPIQTIANTTAQTVSNAEVALERIFELLDQKEAVEFSGGLPCPAVRGELEVRDLCFSYNPGKPVLQGVSLKIPAGSMVALVGPSGAGKTSLVHLLCRFYDPDSGSITLDGHHLTDLEATSYRNQISYVSQDNFLFSGSIADNIAYARPGATREEVEEAARLANAHGFIMSFPDGYDTILGERGVNLSGGQRQRVNIARALIRKPRVLIMDEPTSALDAESEAVIFNALTKVFKGLTSIVIAHRLSTVMNADWIYVFDEARLVQSGKHADLAGQDGLYKTLCQKQFIHQMPAKDLS